MQRSRRTEETRSVKSLRQKRRTCLKACVAIAASLWGKRHEMESERDLGTRSHRAAPTVNTARFILKVKRSHWKALSQGVA